MIHIIDQVFLNFPYNSTMKVVFLDTVHPILAERLTAARYTCVDASSMTKEECAQMCDAKGCSAEEKATCMAHYGKDGKWLGDANKCSEDKKDCCDK